MSFLLIIFFLAAGIYFGLSYILKEPKFSFSRLFLSLWSFAIGVSQFKLSELEWPWSYKLWLILALFFTVFLFTYKKNYEKLDVQTTKEKSDLQINNLFFFLLLVLMTLASIAANYYIYNKIGTLPLLSAQPDKLRFIINKEIFGLIEYASLLPRIIIPATFIWLLLEQSKKNWIRFFGAINIITGLAILLLYSSRLVVVFTVLLCYFSYLIITVTRSNWKRTLAATFVTILIVLSSSVAIPAMRQYITYRESKYAGEDYNAFSYISNISDIQLNIFGKNFNWVIPLYIVPSFNLQALNRAVEFYPKQENWYFGKYILTEFHSLTKLINLKIPSITVPLEQIFVPWWNTATFLFSFWVDFSYLGIIIAGIFFGILLSTIYIRASKKKTILSILLFAYFSFVVIMSIYTNYFTRPELYLDLVVIFLLSTVVQNRFIKKPAAKYPRVVYKNLNKFLTS